MQKRAVLVCVAATLLGLLAVVLGFAAEHFQKKAFVRSDVSGCHYRRTQALGCGVVAALLSLAAVTLVTAASGCFCCSGGAARRRGCARTACAVVAWYIRVLVIPIFLAPARKPSDSYQFWILALRRLQVVSAAVTFLYGASRNAGGTGGFTAVRRRPGRDSPSGGGGFDFVCDDLRDGVFVSASVTAAIGIFCAITAYVDALQHRNHRTPTLGVAMEQLQHPVAYPAQPPNGPGPGGNGAAKQPEGTASA
ncbi:unnamed protein product [Urochloa decumbens]|uniref:Uncharacterized protein n=1 Tax=Urochloa decumbens TaxID=240449 RepID=A0ABC8ZZ57_9POAL